MIDDRLRGFDHGFDPERAKTERRFLFEQGKEMDGRVHLFRDLNLGHRDDKIVRQLPAGGGHERRDENIERAEAARAQVFVQRLNANSDERRQAAVAHALCDFERAGVRMLIFLGVGAIAVAILEIEPEIFNRFALQFLSDARVDLFEKRLFRFQAQCLAERGGVGRVFAHAAQGYFPKSAGRISLEEMRSSINGVHRLAPVGFPGITAHEFLIRRSQPGHDRIQFV